MAWKKRNETGASEWVASTSIFLSSIADWAYECAKLKKPIDVDCCSSNYFLQWCALCRRQGFAEYDLRLSVNYLRHAGTRIVTLQYPSSLNLVLYGSFPQIGAVQHTCCGLTSKCYLDFLFSATPAQRTPPWFLSHFCLKNRITHKREPFSCSFNIIP